MGSTTTGKRYTFALFKPIGAPRLELTQRPEPDAGVEDRIDLLERERGSE